MIYTSGSTGKPKGVMLTHRGICNYLNPHPANRHVYAVKNEVNVYLSVTTVSFDMSFKEHAVTLCNGKTLVFAGDTQMNDPRELAKLMNEYKVDCINATPSRLSQYMDYEPFGKALANCKVIMSGGEGYPLSLRDKIKAAAPDARIINTYGPISTQAKIGKILSIIGIVCSAIMTFFWIIWTIVMIIGISVATSQPIQIDRSYIY